APQFTHRVQASRAPRFPRRTGGGSVVRLIRVAPASAKQIHDACAANLEALLPGATILGREVAVPGRGAIDLLAAMPEGRLALVSCDLTLAPEGVTKALSQWDWVCENLPALRALGGLASGADTTSDPRLLLVAHQVSDDARRLAGRITRPVPELI